MLGPRVAPGRSSRRRGIVPGVESEREAKSLQPGEVVRLDQLPPLGNPDTDFLTGPPGPEELARVNRTMRVEPAVREYGVEHPDVYAGMFLSTGHVYVGFTVDAEGHLFELRQRADDPEVLRAFRADHTYRELREVSERLSSDMHALWEEGIPVTIVGADEYHNRVSVWLRRRDALHETILTSRYGEMLTFDAGYVRHG